MDPDLLVIQPSAPEPIYRQIVAQLQRMIASGRLPPGEPLPSVRDVAARHAVNPMTVSRAYSLLEAEGLLERQRGRGMVVAMRQRKADPAQQRLAQLDAPLRAITRQAHELQVPAGSVIERLRQLFDENQ